MGTERFANIACELIARACDVDKLRYRNSVHPLRFTPGRVLVPLLAGKAEASQDFCAGLRGRVSFRNDVFGLVEVKRCVAGGIDGDQNIGAFHAANHIRVDHHSGRGVQHSEKRPQ